MNNTMTTSPSRTTAKQETRKSAYNGLYLVSRNDRPVAASAPMPATHGLELATGRSSGNPNAVEARSAESIRMKLAACFGAILTAPVVWCLHTLLLSH